MTDDSLRILDAVVRRTAGQEVDDVEEIQTLWKGYGKILRVTLEGEDRRSVVVKQVAMPPVRGKKGKDRSHARKVKSYKVETAWYERWNGFCDARCRTARCLAIEPRGEAVWMVFEDLDAAGFFRRSHGAAWHEVDAGLRWLAEFHATFLGETPDGLWRQGTYWHLDTRPDELAALADPALRKAAPRIDRALRETFQTFVHGDAKIENFCFSEDGLQTAAVDFQYVGGGCGMKDVAYFVGSCFYEKEAEEVEPMVLDAYFDALAAAVVRRGKGVDPDALVAQWRPLYRVAWTDFHRFYKGWSAARFSKNSYSERIAAETMGRLGRK